jgi:hypothetical protein
MRNEGLGVSSSFELCVWLDQQIELEVQREGHVKDESPIEVTMHLRTLLGGHPCTAALKDGSIKSDLVTFDFAEYSPTNRGFKPMVREQAFDVAEMAIVTYLMAKSQAGHSDARRPQQQARRHPLLHHHDRRLAARHSRQRLRRRPQFDRLGHIRGRACR